jgi:DNA-binding NtrC family response regulator
MEKLNVLVLDDEKRMREEISEYLLKRDFQLTLAASPSEAFELIRKNPPDIAIVDIKLPEMDGLEVLRIIKNEHPDIEVIMISGHGDMSSVIEALRSGATDYFQKPFRLIELNQAIQRTKRFMEVNRQLQHYKNSHEALSRKLYKQSGAMMIGESDAIMAVKDMMKKLAENETASVLILGESGTGKELVAQGIHLMSKRAKSPFHSVNCSAISESLFESEFFGHRKGAFTGAIEDRAGWFEVASKGTLFLDEIGDMPLQQQAKLLRVLEDHKIRRVGGHSEVSVDVRVIAASNQQLQYMASQKQFRLDLYHRLSTSVIHLPPLRDRKSDIPLLVNYFVEEFNQRNAHKIKDISNDVITRLQTYDFPGNIRELRNMVEHAFILCNGSRLQLNHFPFLRNMFIPADNMQDIFDLELLEQRTIEKALLRCNQNKSKAAAMLGITWQSLDRRLKKFSIEI